MQNTIVIDITDNILNQSIEDEKNILKQKGGMWNEISDHCDRIGSIGQQCVSQYLSRDLGMSFEETLFFDANINKDSFDFKLNGEKIDCKASPLGDIDFVSPKSRFLVRNDKEEIDKKIDYYLFVKTNLKEREVHIAGIINYWDFWKTDQTSEDYKMNIKKPCHFVFGNQLKSLTDFIYR